MNGISREIAAVFIGRFGAILIAFATAAFCASSLVLSGGAGELFPASWRGLPLSLALLIILLSALAAATVRNRRLLWLPVGLFWILLLGSEALLLPESGGGLTSLVAPMEALFLIASLGAIAGPRSDHFWTWPQAVIGALMLLLFGAIHIANAQGLSALIPTWLPARPALPLLTGAIQIAAGVGLLWSRTRPAAALAVALLFASWLPLVHAARLAEAPGDLGEWRFALTAISLIGGLCVTAAPAAARVSRRSSTDGEGYDADKGGRAVLDGPYPDVL